MASVEGLVKAYERFVSLPWGKSVAPQQRVWFALYDPRDERRLRVRIGAFEAATVRSDHAWIACDLTDEFARWMSAHDYRESYFESPEDLGGMVLDEFADHVAETVKQALASPSAGPESVVALYGIASLFGFVRVSRLMEMVAPHARGRLLVFFPGEHDNGNYRLLDARDGWNYLAVPVTAQEGIPL
ncbi:DUF1788 domain-containing protein [Rubrobacter marinus]|uniref:DUF1788 domain-containing protein n=1 Tax=Rubrobacter marinus TaxID=2653852 RepID=A0A6G8PSP2_9ACTN|nr:BREX protein BrxB domain-containing protein [Rubrobacter marinus]QIN77518.1 DUF1788 domain-containing protein [Rubrobacter marinus]